MYEYTSTLFDHFDTALMMKGKVYVGLLDFVCVCVCCVCVSV